MIPEAKMAYPALSDSAAYICDVGTLSSFVCKIIATITPYIATASQKITLQNTQERKSHHFVSVLQGLIKLNWTSRYHQYKTDNIQIQNKRYFAVTSHWFKAASNSNSLTQAFSKFNILSMGKEILYDHNPDIRHMHCSHIRKQGRQKILCTYTR